MNKKMLTHAATTLSIIRFAIVVTAIGLLATQTTNASGNSGVHAGKKTFDGHIYFCAPPMPPVSSKELPNNKLLLTFVNTGNLWVTGNELVDGVEDNKVKALFDASTEPPAPILTRIEARLKPTAYDGRWYTRQLITPGPDGDSGRGFGFGTGDLRGKFVWFTTGGFEFPGLDFPPEESPCGPTVRVPLRGKVIGFSWIS